MGLKLRCAVNPEHPRVYHTRLIVDTAPALDWSDWHCLTCGAAVVVDEAPDEPEGYNRETAVCTNGGEHMPDYDSVSHERGMGDVIDICCAHCGLSGSFRVPNADIMW